DPCDSTETAMLPLSQGTNHDAALGEPCHDGGRAIRDGCAASAATAAPLHRGDSQLMDTESCGHTRRLAPVIAERGEPVNLLWINARVLARGQDRLQCQLEFGVRRLAMAVIRRLTDSDDGDPALKRSEGHDVRST